MENQNERMFILDLIDQGRISASEGLDLLEAVADQEAENPDADPLPPQQEHELPVSSTGGDNGQMCASSLPLRQSGSDQATVPLESAADMHRWKRWWTIPFWFGLLIAVLGAVLLYQSQQSEGSGIAFIAAGLLFTLGVVVTVLAWQSRSAPWLHLRIRQAPGEKPGRIAVSLPLPLQQASWLLRLLSRRFSDLKNQEWEQLVQAIGSRATPENPIIVKVDEGEFGEKVEIYIG